MLYRVIASSYFLLSLVLFSLSCLIIILFNMRPAKSVLQFVKHSSKYISLFLFFSISSITLAQDEDFFVSTIMSGFRVPQSLISIGAGHVGTALPMDDPIGFYYNPAQLGYFSKENNLAVLAMPNKTKWMEQVVNNTTFNTTGISIGYDFKQKFNLPLSIGFGYLHNKLDLTGFYQSFSYPGTSLDNEVYDKFDCYSLGFGIDYYIQFNMGVSIKPYSYKAPVINDLGLIQNSKISGTGYDLGVLINAPISQLFFNTIKFNLAKGSYLKPKFDISLGYSLVNLGKEYTFPNSIYKEALPRTAHLGYNLDFGIYFNTKEISIDAIDFSFAADAEDLLVKTNHNGGYNYQGLFGGINPIKQLILFNKDNTVTEHRGNILKLFETVYLISGRYNGPGYNNRRTGGYGFSTQGIFKILSTSINTRVINYLADHTVIEYYDVNDNKDERIETNFKGLTLILKGIELP